MKCVICNTELKGRQKTACSRQCRIKVDGIKRKESGKVRKENIPPEVWERKRAAAKEYVKRNKHKHLVDRTCQVCGKTDRINKYHAKTRPICQQCVAWKHIPPSTNKDLVLVAKPIRKTTAPTTVLKGTWWTNGHCVICGELFTSQHTDKTCSKACQKKLHRGSHRGVWISRAERYKIYRRDNWICQLCFEPVDSNLEYDRDTYQPEYPSLDHIVPRSVGGLHHPNNLRLAHVQCNAARGVGNPSKY